MKLTYDDVVSICDAHGICLPVDCVELVVAIVEHVHPDHSGGGGEKSAALDEVIEALKNEREIVTGSVSEYNTTEYSDRLDAKEDAINDCIARVEHMKAALASNKAAAVAARPTDDVLWDQTLTERDNYHEWADKLANAIAEHFGIEIGEHSSANNPWPVALEALENMVAPIAQAWRTTEPSECMPITEDPGVAALWRKAGFDVIDLFERMPVAAAVAVPEAISQISSVNIDAECSRVVDENFWELTEGVTKSSAPIASAEGAVQPDRCYAPSCGMWDGTDTCTCQRATNTLTPKVLGVLTNVAGILDVIKQEWSATNSWSDYDQSVRNGITELLGEHYGYNAETIKGMIAAHPAAAQPSRAEVLEEARGKVSAIPTRTEQISGQSFKYVKLHEVLDTLDDLKEKP
jgi:hypothetical protein